MVAAASSLSAYWRLTTIIDVQKITAWGESGFPARFLVDTFRWVRNGQRSESFLITRAVIRAGTQSTCILGQGCRPRTRW